MDRIGRYKIVRELGRGAMGVVYHAIDPNIGRPVAIKTIQLSGIRKPEEQERLRERLFREARSAGSLSHPGIVTIYDVEQQGELAYIAMEYVDGPTLDQLLSEPQPLAPNRIFSILAQTAAALDYAHGKGIVHRDIKPANIMIAGDGTAKITDFGIAKITASDHFTMTGSIVGTPHYMSPEQVQGQQVDGRSDQFSLAVIAYEMLTGEKPYTGEHLTTVVYKIVAEEPVAPHRINATLAGSIDGALRKGLAKKPDARYRTCSEFIDALEKACAGAKNWKPMPRGGSLNAATLAEAPSPSVAIPAARRPARSGGTTTVERVQKRKTGFLPFLAAILMAAALLALIGWQAGPWQNSNPPQTARNDETQPPQTAPPPVNPAVANVPAAPPAGTSSNPTPEIKPSPMPPTQAESKPQDDSTAKLAPPEDVPRPVTQTASPEIVAKKASPPTVHPSATRPVPAGPQPVQLVTSPGGATATLDGHADQACTTPCQLQASPGLHTISFYLTGYQLEHREVNVGLGPYEMPAVILHPQAGVLMLTSSPSGAAILVNGKAVSEVTPAKLSLAPGTYSITVEKNGQASVTTVEIKNGDTRTLKVTLGQ
jgi:serine/threonine protein kinase